MRRVSHITPRYVWDRAAARSHELRNPKAPWITAQAIASLTSLLRPTDRGLEYGSGRSTIWLAQRTAHLSSIETSVAWYSNVAESINRHGLAGKVDLHLVNADEDNSTDPGRDAYLSFVDSTKPLDYVVVDAIYRGMCACKAAYALRPGGLLIVDNIERYLADVPTRSPERIRTQVTPVWTEFRTRVASWRRLWTSNGVTDTAIWIKTD
jgi:predicted O-methyltransferase YrrM